MVNQLSANDFCVAFDELTNSLDYSSLRISAERTSPPLKQMLTFSLKWKLAFNQLPLVEELNNLSDTQKENLKHTLKNFAQKFEMAEHDYYQTKFSLAEADIAYKLAKKPNWSMRFIYIFKIAKSMPNQLDNVDDENIFFFINLLTFLSDLLDYIPNN